MEAERVATEAPAEPERAMRPPGAPLARSPAEFVRALSRTYGNRRVAQALARQPAATAPAPAIAKGYKAVPITDARWQKVDDLLTWTQLGWEARQVMRDHSVPLAEAAPDRHARHRRASVL
jgi:hypothetical protein